MLKKISLPLIMLQAVLFIITILFFFPVYAEDQENCLMCHKYSGMGIYEKGTEGMGIYEKGTEGKAKKRVYYIAEDIFKNTVHGKLRCKDCHVKVDKIPHTDVEKVDCSTNCHIKDPSSGVEFSHKKIVETFNKSVHGIEGTKNPKHKNDLPTCLSCHTNPIVSVSSDKHLGFLNICSQCHEKKEWAERFLKHQFYRMGQRRSSKDIVELCGGCHENRRIMDRHKLDVVVGFKDTFHGKAIKYGFEEVANCLSCHAPRVLGFNPHSILPKTDNNSPINEASRLKTCQNSGGVDLCHPTATREFALGMKKIHPSGLAPSFAAEDNVNTAASGEASKHEADDIFRRNVIYWINTGYKIVIGFVVGGMVVHQALDFRAAARERRRERKKGGAHGPSH